MNKVLVFLSPFCLTGGTEWVMMVRNVFIFLPAEGESQSLAGEDRWGKSAGEMDFANSSKLGQFQ